MQDNALYYGDCLDWMREWPDGSVDLIYLDPPFNSNANYNIIFGTGNGAPAQVRGFEDTWKWDERAARRVAEIESAVSHPLNKPTQAFHQLIGESGMLAYLTYMGERLVEMHRLLKPTGSIYLHCDPTASHYLKALLDAIFGAQNFRNEIVWRIGWISGFKSQKRGWIRNHDTILYYLRTDQAAGRFNKEYIPYPTDYVRRDGKKPTGKGIPVEDTWNCYAADVLDSIMIKSFSREKLGYPTQKPVALLERIIRASSNEGELVLDPFCGCGTAVVAAHNLERRWIGIDISATAIDIIRERRLEPAGVTAPAFGMPQALADARKLAAEKPFDFERWAIQRIPGLAPNERQRGDGGIDGQGTLAGAPEGHKSRRVLAQVKGGRFSLSQFRDFLHVVERGEAACGVYITLDPVTSRQARVLAAEQGDVTMTGSAGSFPRVQLWSVADYFEGSLPSLPPLADPYTGKEIAIERRMQLP